MNLINKNSRICFLAVYLKNYFGNDCLQFSENWTDDSEVLSLVNADKTKLVYIRAILDENDYFLSLETGVNLTDTAGNSLDKNNLTLLQLTHEIAIHFKSYKVKKHDADVHVLNGDALLAHFPDDIKGKKIIMRECLVDGLIKGDDFESFFDSRSAFMLKEHWIKSPGEYYELVGSELMKLLNLNNNATVYLWFEEDLFCQINMWFICAFLYRIKHKNVMFVRPLAHAPYSFGHHDDDQLKQIYMNSQAIIDLSFYEKLWHGYVSGDLNELQNLKKILPKELSFIRKAIDAHVFRIPRDVNAKDQLTLEVEKILVENKEDDFGSAFRMFSERFPHYGFGDLQFKRIYDLLSL